MAMVLVVDDEDVLLEMLASLVEESGHSPVMATNGREALEILTNAPRLPGLVISDVMMPQMNGIDLAKAIKANPRFHNVPLILMSAAAAPAAKELADAFIAKPFNIDHVEALITHFVGEG